LGFGFQKGGLGFQKKKTLSQISKTMGFFMHSGPNYQWETMKKAIVMLWSLEINLINSSFGTIFLSTNE